MVVNPLRHSGVHLLNWRVSQHIQMGINRVPSAGVHWSDLEPHCHLSVLMLERSGRSAAIVLKNSASEPIREV
jgi:hypothetical protein